MEVLGPTHCRPSTDDRVWPLLEELRKLEPTDLNGEVIHSCPTQAEAIRRAADAYNKTRLTPRLKRFTTRWLAWTR